MRTALSLLLVSFLLASPCVAEGRETDSEDAIVRIYQDIVVAEGDTIRGDVVAIGGSITVRGHIEGDAVAIGGSIVLEFPGAIEGDAVTVGGRIEKGEGTRVGGDTAQVTFPGLWMRLGPLARLRAAPRLCPSLISSGLAKLGRIVVLLVIAVLLVVFLPTPTGRLSRTIESSLPRAILFGILGEIAVVPLCAILAVSIIGIPLIPIAIVAVLSGLVFGFAGMGLFVGELFLKRTGARAGSSLAGVAIGVVLIELLSVLGALVHPVTPGLGLVLRILGFTILYFAWTVGFGAVILTRFGTRDWSFKPVQAPALSRQEKGTGNEQ